MTIFIGELKPVRAPDAQMNISRALRAYHKYVINVNLICMSADVICMRTHKKWIVKCTSESNAGSKQSRFFNWFVYIDIGI